MEKDITTMTVEEIKEEIRALIYSELLDDEALQRLIQIVKKYDGQPFDKSMFRPIEEISGYEVYFHFDYDSLMWFKACILDTNTQRRDAFVVGLCPRDEPPVISYGYFRLVEEERVKKLINLTRRSQEWLREECLQNWAQLIWDFAQARKRLYDSFRGVHWQEHIFSHLGIDMPKEGGKHDH